MKKYIKVKRKRRVKRKSSNAGRSFFEAPIQRKCEECEKDEKSIQKKEGSPGSSPGFFSSYVRQIDGKGKALEPSTRRFFEKRMDGDFSRVKIHSDYEATMAAKAVNAKAFTLGNHIVFNEKYLRKSDMEVNSLMAHELVHVKQQRDASWQIQRQPEDAAKMDSEETEAGKIAQEKEAEEEEVQYEPQVLPDFTTTGKPFERVVFGKSISIKGETKANYDGGSGSTSDLVATPAKDCKGCGDKECFNVTGKLTVTYGVSTSVILPTVPEGLTPCQVKRVQDAIDNKIKPHEDQHVAAFANYNGTVVLPIQFTGCKADLAAHVQAMHDADAVARKSRVQAMSDALDPFHVNIDLDCEEPPKK